MNLSIWQIAKEYALLTREIIFLTGRAGTGKTTLLKEILKETSKKTAVVAPTGVAAINASGMTIHSFFQLPLTGFIPTNDPCDPALFTNRGTLAATQKINRERIQVLLELEFLVIDEISMVRADLLDAIDAVLCRVRKSNLPFGGVQVMVIGDLFQLSPVVKNESFRVLANYYKSQYFFDSRVWSRSESITLELTKIYRQEDENFINVLNNVRIGIKNEHDLELLNIRCTNTDKLENVITLTTHNAKANIINNRELAALSSENYNLQAAINGKFSPTSFPVKENIKLKKGCQVMFVRNHPEGEYYNGKIGKVVGKESEKITIKCSDEKGTISVQPTEWKNVKYTVDKKTKEVFKEDIGSFIQYPLKLAWAVTVHKSQGLTFDELILDLADTFAPGQLYVALSRATHIEGLFLLKPIKPENIITDERIINYYKENARTQLSTEHLSKAKAAYEDIKITEYWRFNKIISYTELWIETIEEGNIPNDDQVLKIANDIHHVLLDLDQVGMRFQSQLVSLTQDYKTDDSVLDAIFDRCKKGILYFTGQLYEKVITNLEKHYKQYKLKSRIKRYLPVVESLIDDLWFKMSELYEMQYRSIDLHSEQPTYQKVKLFDPDQKKPGKGATYKVSLELLNENNSIEDIAKIRSLAIGTIQSHMNRLLKEDKISLDQIMHHERQNKIIPYFKKNPESNITEIKGFIPFETDYGELRWIQTYLQKLND